MKKTVRHVRTPKEPGGGEIIACETFTELRKLRAKLDLAACDLHGASPFLSAERDPDRMLSCREGDVRRGVWPERLSDIRP